MTEYIPWWRITAEFDIEAPTREAAMKIASDLYDHDAIMGGYCRVVAMEDDDDE